MIRLGKNLRRITNVELKAYGALNAQNSGKT